MRSRCSPFKAARRRERGAKRRRLHADVFGRLLEEVRLLRGLVYRAYAQVLVR